MSVVLAIDDKQDNLAVLSALLKDMIPECTVITALSGPEGIKKAKEESPDVVLLAAHVKAMLRMKKAEDGLRSEKALLEDMVQERVKNLREERDRAQKYLDVAGVLLIIIGADQRVGMINRKGREIFGYNEDEIIGKNFFDHFIPERMRDDIKADFNKVMEGERDPGQNRKIHVLAGQGMEKIIAWQSTLLRDDSGEIIGMLGSGEDITDRKKAEKELMRSRELLQNTFRSLKDGLLIIDSEKDRIINCNPAACEVFGYPREELIGNTCLFLHTDESSWREFEKQLEKHLDERGCMSNFKWKLKHREGKIFSTEINVAVVRDENGVGRGKVCVIRDITEHEKLEEQFLQSQKMEAVGRLADGVAHDFNNLLTAILGYSELLLNNPEIKSTPLDYIAEIKQAGMRAVSLTRQLLIFSRKQVLRVKDVDLNLLIGELKKMLGRLIGEDIAFLTGLEEGIGVIKADPGQIEQVVMNLVVNARDAMPEGGKITVETCGLHLDAVSCEQFTGLVPGEYVRLSVSDTGHGMESSVMEHIFEPFFTTRGREQGSGLGLSTVYGIVKQSGGDIRVKSEVGRGTRFDIFFPRVEEVKKAEDEEDGFEIKPLGGKGTSVLVVEDEKAVRAMICLILKNLGYRTASAANGREALEFFEGKADGDVDLVITDIVMPEMGGRQLAEKLLSRYPGIKVLLMTGYTNDDVVRQLIDGERVMFLRKPFSASRIVKSIRDILDRERSLRIAG